MARSIFKSRPWNVRGKNTAGLTLKDTCKYGQIYDLINFRHISQLICTPHSEYNDLPSAQQQGKTPNPFMGPTSPSVIGNRENDRALSLNMIF